MPTPTLWDKHDQQALDLELKAVKDVSANLHAQIKRINRAALAGYSAATKNGQPFTPAAERILMAHLGRLVGALSPSPSKALHKAVRAALRLGAKQAQQEIGKKVTVNPRPDRELARYIRTLDKAVQQDLKDALKFMRVGGIKSQSDLVSVMGKLNRAVVRIERTTSTATNRAVNLGTEVVSRAAGIDLLWVAEKDACLTCLKYSGLVVKAGESFPAGLTFASTSTVEEPIKGPPAHPHCRCRCKPWLGSLEDVGPTELPDVLKREAQRSVLRGVANGSERANLKAADRLLKAGTSLPKTVQARAKRSVSAGSFDNVRERILAGR